MNTTLSKGQSHVVVGFGKFCKQSSLQAPAYQSTVKSFM